MRSKSKWLILVLTIVAMVTLPAVSFAAGGSGPADALIPTGASQNIAPHAETWYRFDYGGDKSLITVALDANLGDSSGAGASGLGFSVYLPQAISAWQNGDALTPIGNGAPTVGHDLLWAGRFNSGGTFYVVVRNDGDSTLTYRLNVTGDSVTTTTNFAPTATPLPNPFATPAPLGSIQGGKILFQDSSGGNIYIAGADGSGLTRVTVGLDPALSPDGTMIAFARQGPNAGLYISNADGSNERLVYGANEIRSPSWSPDGTRIVFTMVAVTKSGRSFCFRGRCFGSGDTVIWKLRQYHLSDGTVTDVFTPPSGGVSPTYNADNNTIAFVNGEMGLLVTSSDNHFTPYVIAGDMRITSPAYDPLNITAPTYSPDGTKIAFMISQAPTWQIAVANADGSNVRGLTRMDPLDFVHPNNVAPIWSPDGKQILFLSNRNGKWEFFAINADGTNERQVLKNVTDQVTLNYSYNAERVASWTK